VSSAGEAEDHWASTILKMVANGKAAA
jgi:hypothetical protein